MFLSTNEDSEESYPECFLTSSCEYVVLYMNISQFQKMSLSMLFDAIKYMRGSFMSTEPEDSEPLTQNHFLHTRRQLTIFT
ncbi:hypothetical protein T02_5817 [Trichinella nativa]|uniref:Uncharacterized protein n=1 Tax=Trichinella nativa TaxID=6335 RepID=A0A0V1LEE5_9BILA|nr:hypothetical protein T02_5817 [Trichinella nativa]